MIQKLLIKPAFNSALQFMENYARPLELARFRYSFQSGSRERVLEALTEFQNSPGGFGNALEPDLRTPFSSALCTSIAFQIYRELNVAGSSLAAEAVNYLLETWDESTAHWRIIPLDAQDSPHAPWWDQTDGSERFDAFSLNPTAEILGYLYDHRSKVPADVLRRVSDAVVENISNRTTLEMHEILCCLRLLETHDLPSGVSEPVFHILSKTVRATVVTDPSAWKGYGLRPLQVIKHPESKLMTGLEEAVNANLDFEIDAQQPDGSWTPSWSWGDSFPEAWESAREEWSGILTLDTLTQLKRFHRMDAENG